MPNPDCPNYPRRQVITTSFQKLRDVEGYPHQPEPTLASGLMMDHVEK